MKKAVILLSGGLDSTTCLAIAKANDYDCYALSFAYGQRHAVELAAAKRIAEHFSVREHRIVNLDIKQFGASALTDNHFSIPETVPNDEVPITYVPARNTIFLAIALGYAEAIGAHDIFIGVSAIDYSNYPDCRPEFIQAFTAMAQLGTKVGTEGESWTIHTPLIHLNKAETIQAGLRHGVDYSLTVSCYQADADGQACGHCHSCHFRKKGFEALGIPDPTHYSIHR